MVGLCYQSSVWPRSFGGGQSTGEGSAATRNGDPATLLQIGDSIRRRSNTTRSRMSCISRARLNTLLSTVFQLGFDAQPLTLKGMHEGTG